MVKASAKLSPRGNSLAVTLPKEVLDAAGLKQGDDLSLLVRDDGAIEITRAVPGEAELQEAFEWSLGRYAKTYEDLAK
ncbi:MAG: AbrB/MazE/SpoVT family DNA-binding domain-containing protein [Clostridiaceae bacterium]|nr:AbrB/MazE/SpoVT family DNA-binding domain-containing protein [Clostridiaceae bacterium]